MFRLVMVDKEDRVVGIVTVSGIGTDYSRFLLLCPILTGSIPVDHCCGNPVGSSCSLDLKRLEKIILKYSLKKFIFEIIYFRHNPLPGPGHEAHLSAYQHQVDFL